MCKRSLIAVAAALCMALFVQADDKESTKKKVKPARGTVVGTLVCSKCNFKATEKCATALRLGKDQFVVVAGKAGESLFKTRCSGKLVRVSGAVTLKDGILTITSAKSKEIAKKNVKPRLALAGKLVCSKCDFKIGECAAALKSGEIQVLLEGDAAKALFKARCSGAAKVAIGTLTKVDGNTIYLTVSKVVDGKKRAKKKTQASDSK